jgi:hypothetical protein
MKLSGAVVPASVISALTLQLGRGQHSGRPMASWDAATLPGGEVAERLMAALLKSAESKDFVGSNPTLSAIVP